MSTAEIGDTRVERLLAAMTWEQKLAQLQIAYRPRLEDAMQLVRGGLGAVFWPRNAENTNELQRVAVEESPHGIPLLVGLDVVHGQRTIFPIPLAQAASFDTAVTETDGRISAAEARSGGVNWTFAPMIDVSRDPRWGRVAEGFGEDTYLNSSFGAAKVRGLQGDCLADIGSILACAKHYVAYGAAEGGRDYNTVDLSEYRLRNVYLEPFAAATAAGCATVMAAFNTVSGRPAHAHQRLLTEVLKNEFGFQGIVVSDAAGVENLVAHGIAVDPLDALTQSLAAGLDMEMGGNIIAPGGPAELIPGELTLERVDDAVRRILRLKLLLGLFDNSYVEPTDEVTAPTAESRAAARTAAERSAVLLKNDGVLPLPPGPLRLLLVGPYADSTDHLGTWVQSFAAPAGSIADAFRAERPDIELTVLPGASFDAPDRHRQDEASRAAADADVVVVAVGEPSHLSGEASSRADLRLPGDQVALIGAIAAAGRPFAVVLINGRPLVTSGWIDRAPAVLEAWHLGTEGAAAIVRLLTGAANPAGRLPMSFPRAAGQLPIHYDHENTGRPAHTGGSMQPLAHDIGLQGPANTEEWYTSKYRDLPLGPEFSFGHGMSYTTFHYDPPRVSPAEVGVTDLLNGASAQVSVLVANTGQRSGDEVVQLYIRDPVASLAQPVRRLRGFRRITLEPGESSTVTIPVAAADLGFWTGRGDEFVVEPGLFELHVGGTLETTQRCDLHVH